jgi:plastocyanin
VSRKGSEASFRWRRAALAAGCATIVAAGAGGCGSTSTVVGTNAQIRQPDVSVKLTETEYKLNPAVLKIPTGGLVSIEATNAGREYHALRVVVPGKVSNNPAGSQAAQEIGEITPGTTETLTLRLKPGTYTWYCPLSNHRRLGMHGKLIVQ